MIADRRHGEKCIKLSNEARKERLLGKEVWWHPDIDEKGKHFILERATHHHKGKTSTEEDDNNNDDADDELSGLSSSDEE